MKINTNQWVIGIDLGGTKIEVALVNSLGQIRDQLRIPTESQYGYKSVLKRITETIHQVSSQNVDIVTTCAGIGVPGQISKSSGIVHYAPNLKWNEVNLKEDLSALLHKQVWVCNDVRAATWGELYFGAAKNCDDAICIFIGTGIGGGIISGGRILTGYNNSAGELGHMTIDMHGPECHCGNKGCFEALASGWAIERDARNFVTADKKAGKLILDMAQNEITNITARIVIEAAHKNDELACKIVNNLCDYIIAGSVAIVNTLGPSRLILGGGIMEGLPQLIDRIDKGIKKSALKAATKHLEVISAELHNDSGVIGAAAFAIDSWKVLKEHSK